MLKTFLTFRFGLTQEGLYFRCNESQQPPPAVLYNLPTRISHFNKLQFYENANKLMVRVVLLSSLRDEGVVYE